MTLQPSSRSVVSVPLLLTTGVAVNVQRFRCYLVPRCHGDLTGVDINLTAGVYTPENTRATNHAFVSNFSSNIHPGTQTRKSILDLHTFIA